MRIIQLAVVIVAAAGLALWRGVAMYRQTFHRKNL
jgi:type IV secretory pathway VirB2 component (pilin)